MIKTIKFSLLFICMLGLTQSSDAKIWTVDNTPGSGADSTTIQGVINVANANDTIIVMPSITNYTDITVTKKLYIYTRGHSSNNIDKDRRVYLSSINITTGGSGSVIKGLMSYYVYFSGSNINFQNCMVLGSFTIYNNSNNNVVLGCVFTNTIFTFSINDGAYNNIISNCYFVTRITGGSYSGSSYGMLIGGNSSNLIKNCLFAEIISGGSVSGNGFVFFKESYAKVYNCLLWSNHPTRARFDTLNYGSIFKNNLTYSANSKVAALPGTGNLNDTLPVFVGGYNSSNNLPIFRPENNMRLTSSSPGKNKGTDSTDVGLYGGGYEFSFEGNVPGVAIFNDFEVMNPVVKKGGILKVKVSARKPD